MTPTRAELEQAGLSVVEILTTINGNMAVAPLVAAMTRDDLEHTTLVMAGMLYGATRFRAVVFGVPTETVLQQISRSIVIANQADGE